MKKLALVVLVLAVCILLVSVVLAESNVLELDAPGPTLGQDESLVGLPFPDLAGVEVRPNLDRPAAEDLARSLMARAAGPLEARLHELQAQGKLQDYRVRYEPYGVVVTGAGLAGDALATAAQASVLAGPGEAAPECVVKAGDALARELMARSAVRKTPEAAAPNGTDPSIYLYVAPPYAETDAWTNISGRTDPNVTVKAEIVRAGKVIATPSTTSYDDGTYYLYPSYHSCPSYGYDWTIRNGDTVRVIAGSKRAETVAVFVDVKVDPTNNFVWGRTAPNRSLQVRLYQRDTLGDLCNSQASTYAGVSDSQGRYSVGTGNFDRAASAEVYVYDANGNYSSYSASAYRIECSTSSNWCELLMPGDEKIDVTVHRASGSGDVVYSGRTSPYGWFDFSYDWPPLSAGDVVTAVAGGHRLTFTAASWENGELDPNADLLVGKTSAGRRVETYFERDYNTSTMSTCDSGGYCASAAAAADGSVAIRSPRDVVRGDYASPDIYDQEGNYQYTERHPAAAIYARLSYNSIQGIWKRLGVYLNVKLSNEWNSPLAFFSSIYPDSYDGRFYVYSGYELKPGYKIEVSDGRSAETMTVQDVTARLENSPQRLSVSARAGHLLTYLWDYRGDTGYYYGFCRETEHSGGTYTLSDPQFQIANNDDALVRLRGPDGHYTERSPSAFGFGLYKEDKYLWGYTETPNASALITVKRGGATAFGATRQSDSNGYFYLDTSTAGSNLAFKEGDEVAVATSDGDTASIVVPPLSVGISADKRAIEGTGPAGKRLVVDVRRVYSNGWYGWSQPATTGGDGRYSTSFAGKYWSRDCSAVDLGHSCIWPVVTFTGVGDNEVRQEGVYPLPVTADAFEGDNSRALAAPYAGRQSHTFHEAADEDWVSFRVTSSQYAKGARTYIEMPYLGWGTTTIVDIYDANGSQIAGSWWIYDQSTYRQFIWSPPGAGTYYLRLRPAASSGAGACDSRYDLVILTSTSWQRLPVIVQ